MINKNSSFIFAILYYYLMTVLLQPYNLIYISHCTLLKLDYLVKVIMMLYILIVAKTKQIVFNADYHL
ncbi:MAG: hypothetical protein ACI9IA_002620 [Enterobacterales bacterium]|jgi:hypothetical protein